MKRIVNALVAVALVSFAGATPAIAAPPARSPSCRVTVDHEIFVNGATSSSSPYVSVMLYTVGSDGRGTPSWATARDLGRHFHLHVRPTADVVRAVAFVYDASHSLVAICGQI